MTHQQSWIVNDANDEEAILIIQEWIVSNLGDGDNLTITITSDKVT